MSRHRDVRNIKIEDELDDDALSDGGEEMSDEQLAQMHEGLQTVREIVGSAETSGISDEDIKDALWEYYFDHEKTVEWVLEEQTRRQQAKERKVPNITKELPPLPHELQEEDQSASNAEYYHPENYAQDLYDRGSRVPAIFLAQQQHGYEEPPEEPPEPWEYSRRRSYLTTIMERSERTETTPRWSPMTRHLPPPTPLTRVSSITESSYGEPIESPQYKYNSPGPLDPNLIPVSPPASALGRLSLYEPPPSQPPSDARSDATATPRQVPSEITPPPNPEVLPEIPDYNSKSGSSKSGSQAAPEATPTQKKSKLAQLASSRASNRSQPPSEGAPSPVSTPKASRLSLMASSRSSLRSGGDRSSASTLDSVKTYPALRPTAESLASPKASTASIVSSSDHEIGANAEYYNGGNRESTAMSSVVNRAIQAALELEAMDDSTVKSEKQRSVKRASSAVSSKVTSPITPVKEVTTPKAKSPSLVPTKSAKSDIAEAHSIKEVQTFRAAGERTPQKEPSKLAKLAMAKTGAGKGPKLPKPVTEYLTPVANGPTVTTAITTSYQSLFTLTDPARSQIIPEQYVVPLNAAAPSPSRSKLAMKSKRGYLRDEMTVTEEEQSYVVPSIFTTEASIHVRASPSAFASLLVDEGLTGSGMKDKEKSKRRKDKERRRRKEADSEPSTDSQQVTGSQDSENVEPLPIPGFSPTSFKFDGPSPDDIVMNARRGTSLGQKAPARKPIAT